MPNAENNDAVILNDVSEKVAASPEAHQ